MKLSGSGPAQHSGWATAGWAYGENVDLVIPKHSYAPMYSKGDRFYENKENYSSSEINDEGVEFNEQNRTLTVNKISGLLNVNSQDLKNNYSTFQIKICTYKMFEDEAIISKVLWSAKATIINGELYLEGGFDSSDFINSSRGDSKMFKINGVSKSIILDKNINIDNVCVQVSGDGGNLGIGVTDEYAPDLESTNGKLLIYNLQKDTQFNFELFNTSETIGATLTKNTQNKSVDEIAILSLDGKTIKSNKLSGDNEIPSISIADLPSGAYLYLVKSGNDYFSKKFIKN